MHTDAFAKLGDLDELVGRGAFALGEGGRIWLFGIVMRAREIVGLWAVVRGFLSFGCVFACLGAWVRVCLVWRKRWGARV